MSQPGHLETIPLAGLDVAACNLGQLLDTVFQSIRAGQGGWLMTLNVDLAHQSAADPDVRALHRDASIVVADGMPLIWASRLRGTPLPERIAGSDLVFHLSERCAAEGRRIFLLGGAPEAATTAGAVLEERWPELEVAGAANPWIDVEPTEAQLAETVALLRRASPDLVLVALGSPKTERLVHALRPELPATWWVGVGIGLGFAAGQVRRAPPWIRSIGAEWLHRLSQEPVRLARRYLVDDLPFALKLLGQALAHRVMGRGRER